MGKRSSGSDFYKNLPNTVCVTSKHVERKDGLSDLKKPRLWAERMVNEGRAIWVSKDTIEIQMNRKSFKNYIMKRHNCKCVYCGGEGNTVEHILPYSRGGLLTPKNCVCACETCNIARGTKSFKYFIGVEKYKELVKTFDLISL